MGEARRLKCAYFDNPDKDGKKPSAVQANYWKTRKQIQSLDADGRFFGGSARLVEFADKFNNLVYQVRLIMDYSASPRPKIKSHEITHYIFDDGTRGPNECRNYKVEIEDLATGDPALQGEWIKSITPADVPEQTAPAAAPGTGSAPAPR